MDEGARQTFCPAGGWGWRTDPLQVPSGRAKHAPHGNAGALGSDGIFLSSNRSSNTSIVGTKDGVITARSTTRKPERDRWLPDEFADLRGGSRA